VIVHGRRCSGTGGPRNWVAADIVRVAGDALAEHWDVLQDEATRAESQTGLPMLGTTFFDRPADAAPALPFAQPQRARAKGSWRLPAAKEPRSPGLPLIEI
jgi:hypothetical protein